MEGDKNVILVTGGSGLVGQAIKTIVEREKLEGTANSKIETWIFCGSKDGDLRYVNLDLIPDLLGQIFTSHAKFVIIVIYQLTEIMFTHLCYLH